MIRDERSPFAALLLCSMLAACGDGGGGTGSGSSESGSTGAATGTGSTDSESGPDGSGSDATSEAPTSSEGGDGPGPPVPCPDDWNCKEDPDGDDKPFSCDNAPQHTNPDQSDLDFDSFGDIVDLCPTVQSLNNTADSDSDGIGNDCDRCRNSPTTYNADFGPSGRLAVRNVPLMGDRDHDGVGDACDNCVAVPNCGGYGDTLGLMPWTFGDPIDHMDATVCQQDVDADGIGDACVGDIAVGAAGPAGFGDGDDFDQDGLANAADTCPRLVVAATSCDDAAECPAAATCTAGVCNHADTDADGVGDACDTCPWAPNPGQLDDPTLDDTDRDFVGDACESDVGCIERHDPRRLAFYDVSASGFCCTTVYHGRPLSDPDGNPLDVGDLPDDLDRGVLALPPGCPQALDVAGVIEASPLLPADVGGIDALWDYVCLLPQWDQDYDGIGDTCDLCGFAFDPQNETYVDINGMEWPNDGKYCNGEYSCSQ